MEQESDLVEVARELVAILEQVRAAGYRDQALIQRAKTLNFRLAPAYKGVYGGTPIISTDYPSWVWWPRAREHASQVLAALEAGLVLAKDGGESLPSASSPAPDSQPDSQRTLTWFVVGPIGDKLAQAGTEERVRYEQAMQVFEEVIQPVCAAFDVTSLRADTISAPGEIPEQICRQLRWADVVIADLSGANPNVMYELGLRHSTGKITIQIGEGGRLPFDVSAIRTIKFKRTEYGLVEARDELKRAVEAALAGCWDPPTAMRVWQEGTLPQIQGREASEPLRADATSEPGFLDLLAEMEASLQPFAASMNEFAQGIEDMRVEIEQAGREMESSRPEVSSFAHRLTVARKLARALEGPVSRMEAAAGEYSGHMSSVDAGMSSLIELMEQNPALMEESGDFISSIEYLAAVAQPSLDGLRELRDSAAILRKASKDLAPVEARIAASLDTFMGLSAAINRWKTRLDAMRSH